MSGSIREFRAVKRLSIWPALLSGTRSTTLGVAIPFLIQGSTISWQERRGGGAKLTPRHPPADPAGGSTGMGRDLVRDTSGDSGVYDHR